MVIEVVILQSRDFKIYSDRPPATILHYYSCTVVLVTSMVGKTSRLKSINWFLSSAKETIL